MSREDKIADQKSLCISDLQIDSSNFYNSVGNSERGNFDQPRCSHCGGSYPNEKYFKQHRKDKGHNKSPFNFCNSNNKRTEINGRKPNTCFRCGSGSHFIKNCSKLDT